MKGLKVVTCVYDFLKWAIPQIGKFPRNQRYTLGSKIEEKLLRLLELLIEAQYSKEKTVILKKANLEIEQLRYLFRLSNELRLMNLKAYELSARYLIEIGAQVGGWLKYQSLNEKTSSSL